MKELLRKLRQTAEDVGDAFVNVAPVVLILALLILMIGLS